MKRKSYFKIITRAMSVLVLCMVIFACSQQKNGQLYSDNDYSKWKTTGDVSIKDDAFTLSGPSAHAVLKNGNYQNFDLCMELRTTTGGKGAILFHTDASMTKGHKIAINNDLTDPT